MILARLKWHACRCTHPSVNQHRRQGALLTIEYVTILPARHSPGLGRSFEAHPQQPCGAAGGCCGAGAAMLHSLQRAQPAADTGHFGARRDARCDFTSTSLEVPGSGGARMFSQHETPL